MTPDLQPPLFNYFDAQNSRDISAMLACFADEAHVRDEGRDMAGRAAIRTWMEETTRKYHPSVTPKSVAGDELQAIVTAQVSGTFPGSPVELHYHFTLAGRLITRLEIR